VFLVPAGAGLAKGPVADAAAISPTVRPAVAFGVSAPVRGLPRAEMPSHAPWPGEAENEGTLVHPTGDGSGLGPDPRVQATAGGSGIPPTSRNFEGIDVGGSSSDGVIVGAPPGTDGDVGTADS